jgi:ligand-binding sensor domain-containing protein
MKVHYFRNPIYSLLLVILFISSCKGQAKSGVPKEVAVEQTLYTGQSPKLAKTQGSNEHQNVHCILQDRAGNLWFGTTGEGVYRYNGKVFTQFTVRDGLSDNAVWSILEDKSGMIWFGTNDGVSRYDGKAISRVSFLAAHPNNLLSGMSGSTKNAVWSMMQDKTGIIWFGTSEDLYCYDGKSFSRFLDRENIINDQKLQLKWVQCLLEDRNGKIWMGSGPHVGEGVIQFDGKSITSTKPIGDGWIRYMLADRAGNIWFSGRLHGVFRYDGRTFTKFTERVNIGAPILEDRAGNIWFTGEESSNAKESVQGIWSYDGKTFANYAARDGMGKYSVWSMLEDRNGNIWIGTRNCGLYRYDGKSFMNFSE